MKIAVLFDGAGLARLGLEQAGHDCTGFEIDPLKHRLSLSVGSGKCVLIDARRADLASFDAVWASPPCQNHSDARTQGPATSQFAGKGLLGWCLKQKWPISWIENVTSQSPSRNAWGKIWNASQFLRNPIQNRNRIIAGNHNLPKVFRPYSKIYPGICPCITATEYKGCASDSRRASRFYGRRLTIEECAFHQGFKIPRAWRTIPLNLSRGEWLRNIYEAIGNGVPVYMAKSFGKAYEC